MIDLDLERMRVECNEPNLGRWSELIPQGGVENWRYRLNIVNAGVQSARARRDIRLACKQDMLFYIQSFSWTVDPRGEDKVVPFNLWPIQRAAIVKLLWCIRNGRDCVIEKSRDMGASWLCLSVFEWLWRYRPGFDLLFMSRNEELVYKPGNKKALFTKLDILHENQPKWLMPRMKKRKRSWQTVEMGGSLDGETTTDASSVGDRRSAILLDEFARMPNAKEILQGSADVTRCRIFNFTPFGTDNTAYELTQKPGVEKVRMHWSDHPTKRKGLYRWGEDEPAPEILDKEYVFPPDYPFVQDGKLRSVEYDYQESRRTPEEMAREWDINYQGSKTGFYSENIIKGLIDHHARPPVWDGDVNCDPESGEPIGFLKSEEAPLKLWLNFDLTGYPPRARMYAIGADISTGNGASNSVLSIWDCGTAEKVGEYCSPYTKPERLAVLAVALGRMFQSRTGEWAKICWEHNGPGAVFGKLLLDLGYQNLWKRSNEFAKNAHTTNLYGWFPSPDAIELAHTEYRAALQTGTVLNPCEAALRECLDFFRDEMTGDIRHSNMKGIRIGPGGIKKNHGDRVVADMLGVKVVLEQAMYGVRAKRNDAEMPVNCVAWRMKRADERRAEAGAGVLGGF